MGAEAHQIFLDAEDLEILQIHLVHGVELLRELLRRAIDVRVVHVERAHAHEAEQFAGSARSDSRCRIRPGATAGRDNCAAPPQRAVMMRAVHRFEVVAIA